MSVMTVSTMPGMPATSTTAPRLDDHCGADDRHVGRHDRDRARAEHDDGADVHDDRRADVDTDVDRAPDDDGADDDRGQRWRRRNHRTRLTTPSVAPSATTTIPVNVSS